ncbi:MAG TPA: LUD domain-containing protein [Chloroflexota bacterium]|nr:LUD domain-containing protein [Chloroflexota bacterium]
MAAESTAISLWSSFTAKAELVGTAVMRTGSQETAPSLLRAAAAEVRCTASLAERFPRTATALGWRASKQRAMQTAHPSADVVAVARFAIAETGSVALAEPDQDRGACFLSERLWVLVAERDILATLEQGMQRMRDLVLGGARHPLLMTGPSRTADIERVLTIGVHGPRALVVVIVGDT